MGLYAELNLRDLGFWPTTKNAGVIIDYDSGFEIFKSVFHTMTSEYCPIRTGNLFGSLKCESNGMTLLIHTECEYAEYVEYGTWKQMAQPYFTQAISEAFGQAYPLWVQATEEALIEEYWFVFNDVFNQVMSDSKAQNSPVFAERWAHNSAMASVNSQRTYLEIEPAPPEVIII